MFARQQAQAQADTGIRSTSPKQQLRHGQFAFCCNWRQFLEDSASRRCFLERGIYHSFPKLNDLLNTALMCIWKEPLHQDEKVMQVYEGRLAFRCQADSSLLAKISIIDLNNPSFTAQHFYMPNREYPVQYRLTGEALFVHGTTR